MRIIAGTLKGRRLDAPGWPGLRPTSDRLRETLFNVLAPHMEGSRFLDAYAGTGAVGIEALSRGAAHVTFVEEDRRAQALIEANLDRCGVRNRYAIIRAGFNGAAKRLEKSFDVLFLDPPYGGAQLSAALETAGPLVTGDGVLIIEHAKRDAAPGQVNDLVLTRDLVQSDSVLSFYRNSAALKGCATHV